MAAAESESDSESTSASAQLFYDAWRRRNAERAERWLEEQPPHGGRVFANLHAKIQQLRFEIAGLVAQDTNLFEQLFALQDAILELKEQLDYSSSSECSSPFNSPCSTLSSSSTEGGRGARASRSASFVRQHVSYPPIARNRSRRAKPSVPHHGCQSSYDSGIHNSDLEIFV